MPNLEVVEIVLAQCNIADNQYQQKSEVQHTFTSNRFYDYLLNVEPSNLLLTYNTELDNIRITCTD